MEKQNVFANFLSVENLEVGRRSLQNRHALLTPAPTLLVEREGESTFYVCRSEDAQFAPVETHI